MSSAANDKRGHLEDELQRRMHDAEASPSPDLWARIDHDLTLQENKHYKNRMVLYRQLAAACFVLFMLAGALLTYNYRTESSIDEGIAAMQLPGTIGESAASEETPEDLLNEESETLADRIASLPNEKEQASSSLARAGALESKNLSSRSGAGAGKTERQSINATLANSYTAVQNAETTAPGHRAGGELTNATAPSSSIAEGLGSFGSPELTGGRGNAALSRFDVGRPFFQTARQAITSVPLSFMNGAEKGAAGEAGRTRSVVELTPTAVAENAASQKKAEELAIALNTPAAGSEKETKEGAGEGRCSLGLGYAPSYFNQNIQMPGQMMGAISRTSLVADGPATSYNSAFSMDQARDEFEANTDPAFSYAVEAKAGFKLFNKLKLLTGIGFTQNMARTKSSYVIKQFLYKPGTNERVAMPGSTVFLPSLSNNFTTDSLSVKKTDGFYVNYRYRHITLPVGLQYEGNISKNWFWYTAGGMAANFLVQTTVMASNSEVKDVSYGYSDDSPFRKVQFSGNVSAGVGKRISNLVSVTAGPEFRGYLNSLIAEPEKALAPQGNPYTIGINMSVNYNLGQK